MTSVKSSEGRKKEEGRRKREEGRKKEEGRGDEPQRAQRAQREEGKTKKYKFPHSPSNSLWGLKRLAGRRPKG
ncbi:MAG: hypothetical protein ABI262_00875 [Microcoleus sp.]